MASPSSKTQSSTDTWEKVEEPEVELTPVEAEKKASIATKEELQQKTSAIKEAIETKDVETLRELATSRDGLLTDQLRRDAWPILLGYDKTKVLEQQLEQGEDYWKTLPVHRDEEQVRLDVERAFVYYPKNLSPMAIKTLKAQLQTLITIILRKHPSLCYFQGFHDICQVLLLVLNLPESIPAGEYLSLLLLRDFMLPTLTPAISHLHLIPPLLRQSDHELFTVLRDVTPYFALSATLTLYSHEVREYDHATRLFDSLLAYGPGFSVYLFIKVLEARKPEILELIEDMGAGDDVLGAVLGRWKGEDFLNLEGWILGAKQLWVEQPIEKLPGYKSLGWASVLRVRGSTLEDGEILFKRQESQVHREKMVKEVKGKAVKAWADKRVRSAIVVGVFAVVIGIMAKRGAGQGVYRAGEGIAFEVWKFVTGRAYWK